jgi:hypothetical protein
MKKWANELNRALLKEEVQMVQKIFGSISLAIKEMQIKTTLGFHLTPVRMATSLSFIKHKVVFKASLS